jgi:hypothetical protein
MTSWTSDELSKIGGAEELQIAAIRSDGTLRKPVTIWVARAGDDLYVRSAYGRTPAWFRSTQVRHEGRITAGGITKDVVFADPDPTTADAIDAAYRTKYRRHGAQYIDSVTNAEARSTTIRLLPH